MIISSRNVFNSPHRGEYLNRVASRWADWEQVCFVWKARVPSPMFLFRNRPEIFNDPGMFAAVSVKGIKTVPNY